MVYSFGLANNMNFEEELAQLGCQVHAFDPTIAPPDLGNPDMMHFHPIGLAHFNLDELDFVWFWFEFCSGSIQFSFSFLRFWFS